MPTDADFPKRRGRPPSGQREAILRATLELLRDRGIAKLTTREIAREAGVSEASVFYHFTDRAGLLQAVFEEGLQPLSLLAQAPDPSDDRDEVLTRASRALDRFFDQVLPILIAAQSDPELQAALTAYISEHDLGPHRGVAAIGGYLRGEQAAGRLAADVDVEAAALMLIGSCFMRVVERQLMGQAGRLPELERVAAALDGLLGAPS
jgi:AcrR family transcriptional regulator